MVELHQLLSDSRLSTKILNRLSLGDLHSLYTCAIINQNAKLQAAIHNCDYRAEPLLIRQITHPDAYRPSSESGKNGDDYTLERMDRVLIGAKWLSISLEKSAWPEEVLFEIGSNLKRIKRLDLNYRTDIFKALVSFHQRPKIRQSPASSSSSSSHSNQSFHGGTDTAAPNGNGSTNGNSLNGSFNGQHASSLTYEQYSNSLSDYCDGPCPHCDHYRNISLVNDGKLCHITYRVILTNWPAITHLTLTGPLPVNMIRQLVVGYPELETLIIRCALQVEDVMDTIATYEKLTHLELHLYASAADGTRLVQWSKKCNIPSLERLSLLFVNDSIDRSGLLSVVLGAIVRKWPKMTELLVTKSPLRNERH